jgi:hypothetical protein
MLCQAIDDRGARVTVFRRQIVNKTQVEPGLSHVAPSASGEPGHNTAWPTKDDETLYRLNPAASPEAKKTPELSKIATPRNLI